MQPKNEISDFNKLLAPWIGKTFKLMNIYIAQVFSKNNFQITREQWFVLKVLNEGNNGFIQNDLACATNRNKATLTRVINVMEKHNLVVRIPSKEDARKKLIYATKTGENLFLKMKPLMLSSLEVIQKGISEEDKKIFINVMEKIQNNLNNNKN